MSFEKAREHFRHARGGSLRGGRIRNELEADEALADGLGASLGRIEHLLGRIVLALEDRRVSPAAELTEKTGFFGKWLG